MNRKIKASLLLLFSCCLMFCLVFGISISKPAFMVSADVNITLEMENGAQVRLLLRSYDLDDHQGLSIP